MFKRRCPSDTGRELNVNKTSYIRSIQVLCQGGMYNHSAHVLLGYILKNLRNCPAENTGKFLNKRFMMGHTRKVGPRTLM